MRAGNVAADLGLNRSTVFGWVAAYRAAGIEVLRAKPVPGRPPRLSGAQLRTLYTLIVGVDPRQYESRCALWTRDLVRQLISTRFGVWLSAVSVGRLLQTPGLSPQRPVFRASQQDGARVVRWRERDYPAIRDAAARVGATTTSPTRPGSARRTTPAPPGHRSARRRCDLHRRPLRSQRDLHGHPAGEAAVFHLHRHVGHRDLRLVLSSPAPRHPRPGVPHRRRPPGAPIEGGHHLPNPPTGACGCSSSRPTRPSSTPTNRCEKTSNTTGLGKPASAVPRTYNTKPRMPCAASSGHLTLSARSSSTRTPATPMQSNYLRSA